MEVVGIELATSSLVVRYADRSTNEAFVKRLVAEIKPDRADRGPCPNYKMIRMVNFLLKLFCDVLIWLKSDENGADATEGT